MTDFTLRPMEPSDGPAIDGLMRHEAQTTAMGITTHYRHDIFQALLAQHPSLYGVVATAPDTDGLVGVATAFTEEVNADGRSYPAAHLENLKVRHDFRRHGLGARLADWRIQEARRRFGGEGLIVTGIEASNAASLATARRWSTQLLGPVRIVIARVSTKPPRANATVVRPLHHGDIEAVVDAVNAFHDNFNLYPPQTPAGLAESLASTSLGEPIRQYRVAVADDGTIVAGAAVTERFKLMVDHIGRMPRPLELLARVAPLFPPDRILRTIELSLSWHAPGRADAGRRLWEAIRFEWRDRATHVAALADPRSSLSEVFRVGRTMMPRLQLLVPVKSPDRFDEDRPVYLWR
ncbi:MAG: GNAT family N-acetyltransferase [Chloroflexi bacterium]|nr:GNAT family N-acetyltransferase [Chloroflexota bacterium]HEV8054028.1 GNAT family N-acetyltransferase [Candidatus Limnocylindrales bacterium]